MPALRAQTCFIPLIAAAILIIENRASCGDALHVGPPAGASCFSEFPARISSGSAASVAGFDDRLDEAPLGDLPGINTANLRTQVGVA